MPDLDRRPKARMPTVKGRAKFARPNRTRRLCQLIIEEERRVSITIGKRQSTFKVIFVCSSGSKSNTRYPRLAVAMIRSGPAVQTNGRACDATDPMTATAAVSGLSVVDAPALAAARHRSTMWPPHVPQLQHLQNAKVVVYGHTDNKPVGPAGSGRASPITSHCSRVAPTTSSRISSRSASTQTSSRPKVSAIRIRSLRTTDRTACRIEIVLESRDA